MRLLLVDDSLEFLAAAIRLLEHEGVQVVGSARNAVEAAEKSRELTPDVVLVDIDLGDESGFDVARLLANSNHRPDVVLISSHAPEDFADLIAMSPVSGFVAKSQLSAGAVREVLERNKP
jgi:two-component system nitrate/nitrite response regulator NarL